MQFSYRLQVDRVGFVCKMVSVDGSVQNRLRILGKIKRNPMDLALGLRGSLLPHREERIPNLELLLAPVLKFEEFYKIRPH